MLNVLIVEDEVLLAMELESEVEATGCKVGGFAADSKEAIALIQSARPDMAFWPAAGFVDTELRCFQ